jgi:hypothetical protein
MNKPSIEEIIADLEKFCVDRGICIHPSLYDNLQVWDFRNGDFDFDPIRGIEDHRVTNED